MLIIMSISRDTRAIRPSAIYRDIACYVPTVCSSVLGGTNRESCIYSETEVWEFNCGTNRAVIILLCKKTRSELVDLQN